MIIQMAMTKDEVQAIKDAYAVAGVAFDDKISIGMWVLPLIDGLMARVEALERANERLVNEKMYTRVDARGFTSLGGTE